MEKRISFLEGFGDFAQGDGFQAANAGIAPGASAMTVALLLRFDTFDLSGGTIATDTKFIAGNVPANLASGWAFFLEPSDISVQAGAPGILMGYTFTNGDKPVGGRVLVAHMTVEPQPGTAFVRLRLFINGTLVGETAPPTPAVFGTGLMSIGANGNAGFNPFGSSADIPSARNGVAGLAYGEFTMSASDVAEHWNQILESEDMADGSFAWDDLWSVRRGLPNLELAGGDSADWADEIGGDVLTRAQFNGQLPTMSVGVRQAQLY